MIEISFSAWWLLAAYPSIVAGLMALFLASLLLSRIAPGLLGLFLSNVAIACDQAANTLTGGDPDDTISARLGRAYCYGMTVAKGLLFWIFVLPLVKALHVIDPYHCEKYALADRSEGRRALWGFRKLSTSQWEWLEKRAALA